MSELSERLVPALAEDKRRRFYEQHPQVNRTQLTGANFATAARDDIAPLLRELSSALRPIEESIEVGQFIANLADEIDPPTPGSPT